MENVSKLWTGTVPPLWHYRARSLFCSLTRSAFWVLNNSESEETWEVVTIQQQMFWPTINANAHQLDPGAVPTQAWLSGSNPLESMSPGSHKRYQQDKPTIAEQDKGSCSKIGESQTCKMSSCWFGEQPWWVCCVEVRWWSPLWAVYCYVSVGLVKGGQFSQTWIWMNVFLFGLAGIELLTNCSVTHTLKCIWIIQSSEILVYVLRTMLYTHQTVDFFY